MINYTQNYVRHFSDSVLMKYNINLHLISSSKMLFDPKFGKYISFNQDLKSIIVRRYMHLRFETLNENKRYYINN